MSVDEMMSSWVVALVVMPGASLQVSEVVLDAPSVEMRRVSVAPAASGERREARVTTLCVNPSGEGVALFVDSGMMVETRPLREVSLVPKGWSYRLDAEKGPASVLIVELAERSTHVSPHSTASGPPPGWSAEPLFDHEEVAAAHVNFEPGTRESPHQHNVNLALVFLTPARVNLTVGEKVEVRNFTQGDVLFLPKETLHAVSNAGEAAFEVLSLALK